MPSFSVILAGGPLVEATRGELKFTASLTGITAALVSVSLNLAIFFGWHTFWPQGSAGTPHAGNFERIQVVVAIAAFIAL